MVDEMMNDVGPFSVCFDFGISHSYSIFLAC